MNEMFPMMEHNPALKPAIGGAGGAGAGAGAGAGKGGGTFKAAKGGGTFKAALNGSTQQPGRTKKSFLRKKLPQRLFSCVENREEFRILDYMPCTNRQPIDLHDPLRVRRAGRQIKLFLSITMYNEHADELRRSLRGVAEQLDQLQPHVTWEEMAVAIIVDGRNKMHKSMKEFCAKELKLFDEGLLRKKHNEQEVTCHIFEKSVEMSKHKAQREYYQPLQLILCIKERNGGKLNSHLWFFSGFCKQLQPEYCFLLDVGTEPQPYAFAKLYMAMENNPQLGGVCGEITVRNPKAYNLIEASQYFEYKISHVMDKAMESVFGYISVLPGAFSAYRWIAIRGEPLNQYFYVEENSVKEMGPFMANMYLAEDRVLCFELLSKRNRNWTMHYVTGSIAKTDVPTTLLELTKQRRRWLNGSFFSLVYYVSKFSTVLHRSDHGLWRRFALTLQFVYMLGLLCLNWVSVGSLFLSLIIIFTMAFDAIQTGANEIMYIFQTVYTFLTLLQVVVGLGSRLSKDTVGVYFVSSLTYGVIMLLAVALSVWHLALGRFSTLVLIASGAAFASYFTSSLIHGEIAGTITVFLQYMFMLPTYVNVFTIFSFCNMHDISWGTKEGNLQHEKARAMGAHGGANRMRELVKNLQDGESKAMGGVTQHDIEQLEALRQAGTTGNKALDDIRRTALAFSEAAQRAMEERQQEAVAKRQAALKKEEQEMAREFETFRTRLLLLWLLSNWVYVTVVVFFDLVEAYAFLIAGLIAFTLVFRMFGSVWYQLERVGKSCWLLLCGWCCCTPFWIPDAPVYDDFKDSDEERWMASDDDASYTDGSYTETESETDSDDDRHRPSTGRSRMSRASRARPATGRSRVSRAGPGTGRSRVSRMSRRHYSAADTASTGSTGSDASDSADSDDSFEQPRAISRPGRTRGSGAAGMRPTPAKSSNGKDGAVRPALRAGLPGTPN